MPDPELKGYWWFFGRVDSAEMWFFHAPVDKDATTASLDTHALIERAAGWRVTCDFQLISLGAEQEPAAAFQAAATGLGMPLQVIGDTCDGQRAAYGQRLILVRPDQYVA